MKHKLLLAGLILLINLSLSAETYSGTCGDNLTWKLENGTLTISGTGDMWGFEDNDYWFFNNSWYSYDYTDKVISIVIHNGVTSIAGIVFTECHNLTSIEIPNSVISIGEGAFYGCRSLTSIEIPNGVTSIEGSTFSGCSSLISVVIPNNVTSIGEEAFLGCSSLTSITIPEGVTSIGEGAFYGCSSLSSIEIPSSVTHIGTHTFDCSGIASITCKAVTPPHYEYDGMHLDCEIDKSIPLYVPAQSIEAYKAAYQWYNFTNILPIEETECSRTEKVQRLFTFCQNDFYIVYINRVDTIFFTFVEDNFELDGRDYYRYEGDKTITTVTPSVRCPNMDSITIDTIRIYPEYRIPYNPWLCADELDEALANGEISFFGTTITDRSQDGLEFVTDGTIHGCDSVWVLDLTPIPNDTIYETLPVCSYPVTWRGKTYYSEEETRTNPVVTPSADGCNGYYLILPEYAEAKEITDGTTVWEDELPYTWESVTFNEAGTETLTLQASDGCDSTVTFTLRVRYHNIVLQESEDAQYYDFFAEDYNGYTVNSATLNRQFTNGKWATLCLPFDLKKGQMTALGLFGRVFEFRYATMTEDNILVTHFAVAQSIEAGKGYIVSANAKLAQKTSFVFPNVTVNTDADNEDITALTGYNDGTGRGNLYLVGTLRTGLLQGSANGNTYLGLKDNKLYYPNTAAGTAVRAYRGFFRSGIGGTIEQGDDNDEPTAPLRVRIVADGETVGELDVVNGEMYDADGDVRAPSSRKFIRNGILYIERNGKTYNAQGKQVN